MEGASAPLLTHYILLKISFLLYEAPLSKLIGLVEQ